MGRSRRLTLGALLVEQDYRCFICKEICEDPTREHVFPRRDRNLPRHAVEGWMNAVVSCRACNAQKAGRSPTEAEIERLLVLKRQATGDNDHGDWLSV